MLGKSQRVIRVVKHLQTKYGANNIFIQDHWESDENAIGLTDQSKQYLVYISTISEKDDNYYVALENPPAEESFPYSSAGEFDNIDLMELGNLLAKHLRLLL